MRKLVFFLIVAGLIGGVVWRLVFTASLKAASAPRGKPPVAVELEKSKQGEIDDVSEFTGTLAGVAEVQISPKISGIVQSMLVDLGDECKTGQLLAVIDDEEAKHAVEESKAKLAVARASLEECDTNLETSQKELERVKTLRQRKVAAVSELETAEAAVSTLLARQKYAAANIQQQEAALRAAEARLAYTKISAPISGYVGKRFVDEGTLVSSSAPILQLADIRTVKTVIGVVEKDYSKISIGLKASLTVDAYPGKTFDGKVSRIAPILDPDTRTAETEIAIDNPGLLLKPGMFTKVRIHFGVHSQVVLVPSRAIVKRDQQEGIFVPSTDQKTGNFIRLTLGLSNENDTEITGLEADQDVIVRGQHLLNDGDPIVLSPTPTP